MKKVIAILIALSLIGTSVALWGCTPAEEEELPSYTLKFGHIGPPAPGGFATAGIVAFAGDLEKATDGRVTVEITPGVAPPKAYDDLMADMYDAVFFNPVQCAPIEFPMAGISTLPWTFPSAVIHTEAIWELWEAGYLDDVLYEDMKVVFLAGDRAGGLLMSETKVTEPADLVGKVLHTVVGMQDDLYKVLGASTDTSVSAGEVSGALADGTLDGNVKGYAPLEGFGWCEHARYVTEPLMGSVFFVFAFNPDAWDRIPEHDQAIIEDLIEGNHYGWIAGDFMEELCASGEACLVDKGATFVEWDIPAVEAAINDAGIWTGWIDEREAAGLPVIDALETVYEFLEGEGVAPPAIGWEP